MDLIISKLNTCGGALYLQPSNTTTAAYLSHPTGHLAQVVAGVHSIPYPTDLSYPSHIESSLSPTSILPQHLDPSSSKSAIFFLLLKTTL